MIKNNLLVALIVLFTGCGGDSVRDGSQGPTSSSYARISSTGVSSTDQTVVDVEIEAVKRFNLEGVAVDIVLSEDGRIAYVASGDSGLEVIDVSNPVNPHFLYSYDLPEYVNYVEIEDDVVYVAYVSKGLQSYYSVHAFDVYSPYNPYYIGSAESQNGVGHSSATIGSYYYEVNSEGLEIFTYYDGINYEKVGFYYLSDSAYALAVHNNYVFIANGRVGLTVLKTNIGGRVGQVH